VELDDNGLEVLGADECLQLLEGAHLGRIAITSGALPSVLPVNFRLVDGNVLFRTSPGSKLEAATANAVVAFEVDDFDPVAHTGWSVMITGIARAVDDPGGVAAGSIPRWAPGRDEHLVEVVPRMISGRRIVHRATVG
jgi:nitroimidazol reductase NimA-like FMN-containing flavoprotein (pyridoxamine 5'-phosphate oxidase superfamily)